MVLHFKLLTMNKIGVYKICSKIKPQKFYIGSSININKRWNGHLGDLRLNKHHSAKMQNHFNKYGENDLFIMILSETSNDNLLSEEQKYIDELHPIFNICPIAGNCLGIKRTEEEKEKCRSYRHTEEAKKRISDALRKRKPTAKMIAKLKERRCKKVIDIKTNIVYESITYASKVFGIHRRTLENMLHGTNGISKIKNKTSLRFYIKEAA